MVSGSSSQTNKVLQLVQKGKPEQLQAIMTEVQAGFDIDKALDPLGRNCLILFA